MENAATVATGRDKELSIIGIFVTKLFITSNLIGCNSLIDDKIFN